MKNTLSLLIPFILNCHFLLAQEKSNSIPTLKSNQLIVDGKPFIILGGELGNSSASSVEYMSAIWPKLKSMHLNTVLVPVYWELMEPEKNHFDFTLIDSAIDSARRYDLKIVFLWFGSWKNSMSCYVPAWIKKDYKTYPRVYSKKGEAQEILTPFSNNNLQADINAYSALLKHIKDKDEKQQTVLMIQVENEIGMLPDARDYHADATKAFQQEAPVQLMNYLQQHKNQLTKNVFDAWKNEGFKTKGTWEQIFGKGLATDEIFIAWHLANYTNKVVEAGKKIYALPLFVNAALNRPNVKPGDYPSGGPLPHLIDIWKAAAPAIDFLSPDFYNPDFKYWNDLYTRNDNPLFIPEHKFDATVAAKAFYAIGHYHALGFSPFSIESTNKPSDEPISKTYEVITQLIPLISSHQNAMNGSWLNKNFPTDTLTFGDYNFIVKHDYTLGWSPQAKENEWPQTGGLIIQTSPDEFIVAGTGIVITFPPIKDGNKVGILNIEEGNFINNQWRPKRTLNGDQSHQGRHLRIEGGNYEIQKLKLYKYK